MSQPALLDSLSTPGAMKLTSAVVLGCLAFSGPVLGQTPADEIRMLREQSNAAIARHDVDGVVTMLDTEYQITVGSGALFQDRAGESEAWAHEFERSADLVYVRTAESIEVSSSGTRAAEIGVWSGSWTTSDGPQQRGGRYAAYWRLVDGSWKLRSELFVTLSCEGSGCF